MRSYLDASVLVPTLVMEPASAAVDRFLKALDRGPIVSDFAASEVASGMSRLVRMGQIQAVEAARRLSEFDAWCAAEAEETSIQSADIRLSALFVRRFELMLRTPDAVHIAACRRLGVPLVSLDRRLASSARQLGVESELIVAT